MSNHFADEQALRERTHRRQLRARWSLVPVVGIGGPLLTRFGYRNHADAGVGSVIAGMVGATIGVGIVLLVSSIAGRRRVATGATSIWFSTSLTLGLSRSQRRSVRRSLRRSTPSSDPLLHLTERDAALRAVRTFGLTVALAVLGTIAFVAIATDDDLTVFGHVFTAALAAVSLGLLAWTIDLRPRARRYLRASGHA